MTSEDICARYLPEDFESNLAYYKSQHQTRGCKITHMLGVPLILLSFLMLLRNGKASAKLQFGGWVLQLMGHYLFEHNKPVCLEVRNPSMMVSAVVFVFEQWKKVFTGKAL